MYEKHAENGEGYRLTHAVIFKAADDDATKVLDQIESIPGVQVVYRTRSRGRLWVEREVKSDYG